MGLSLLVFSKACFLGFIWVLGRGQERYNKLKYFAYKREGHLSVVRALFVQFGVFPQAGMERYYTVSPCCASARAN